MSLTRRIAHNTIIQFTGRALGLIVGLISIALLTRYLGKEGYGEYSTVIAFLQLFGIVADFGLYHILIQMISKPGADVNKITSNIFTLRFISVLFFLVLACLIGFLIPAYPLKIKIGICLTSLVILFTSLNQIIVAIFQKNLKTDKVAWGELIGKAVGLILVVLAVIFGLSFYFILLTLVLGNFANFVFIFLFSLKFVKIKFKFDLALWKEVLKRTWPVGLSIIFSMIYFKMDTIILSLFRTQGEVGIYGASYRLVEVLNALPVLFIGLILPILNECWAVKNLERFKRVLQKAFDFLIMFIAPMVVGGFILSEKIMLLIAGSKFSEAGSVFSILIFAVGFLFLGQLFGHTVIAIRKQKTMMWWYLATAIIGIVGYLIFIPKYSYYGAAGMTVATELLIAVSSCFIVLKTIKSGLNLKMIWKGILSACVMAVFLCTFYSLHVLLLVVLGGLIYFAVLYLLKGYSKDVVREIVKVK